MEVTESNSMGSQNDAAGITTETYMAYQEELHISFINPTLFKLFVK